MKCKYCHCTEVYFDDEYQRWECGRCHLSSHNFETIVDVEATFDNLPVEHVVIEAIMDGEEPSGFVERYIPDEERVPQLKIDVERARLLRWLYRDLRREEKEWGYKWLKDNGFKVVDERLDRRKRKVYVWDRD